MAGLKEKVAKGVVWVSMEKLILQVASFIVGIVLARLLTPADYGTVAMLSIFFAIAGSLATCGFGNALVQSKHVDDLAFNSVFYISVSVSLILYFILFISAPYIALFYHTPVLCPVARVSAISLVLNAINSIQVAELSRRMLFDIRFRISVFQCIGSSVTGITLAMMGFGVWSLVWSSLSGLAVRVVAYWTFIAWRPRLLFSFKSVKSLFSYGWKLTVAGFIHTIYMNMYGFLVGRFYTPADLAFVNKGNSIPSILMNSVDGTILGVSFPALAKLQGDKMRMRNAMRRMIQTSTFLIIPMMIGLAVCAKPLIVTLFGDKWQPAALYVQMYCISYIVWPFNSINTAALSAMGYSGIYLILDMIKKSCGLIAMLISINFGLNTFIFTMCIFMSPFCFIVNTIANGKILGYNSFAQIKDVFPSILIGVVMYGAVFGVQMFINSIFAQVLSENQMNVLVLTISCVVGVCVYFYLGKRFKLQAYCEYVSVVIPVVRKRFPGMAHIIERIAQ